MARHSTPIARLADEVWRTMRIGKVPIIWGPPGVGKTSLINHLCETRGIKVYTLLGSLCDPTDVNGFPTVVRPRGADGREGEPVIKFARRDWMDEIANSPDPWAVFMDELTSVPMATLAALLRPTTPERAFGDCKFDPRRVAIIAAANPSHVAVNGTELPGPAANRLVHLQFPVGPDACREWCEQFPTYWNNPRQVGFGGEVIPESVMLRARSYVAGFLQARQQFWVPRDKDGHVRPLASDKGSCSPRSWDTVSEHVGLCIHDGMSPIEALPLITATVGAEAGPEFATYVNEADLPDPEAVLAAPDKWKPTGRVDVDFSVMTSVAAALANDVTAARVVAACEIVLKAVKTKGDNGQPAYEAGCVVAQQVVRLTSQGRDESYKKVQETAKAAGLGPLEINAKVLACLAPYKKILTG